MIKAAPVVSDSGPLHYLVLSDAVDILPKLFARILIPDAVAVELSHPATPTPVRAFLRGAPGWLEREPQTSAADRSKPTRGAGERAAINLAEQIGGRLLMIDDRAGVLAARARGLITIGTLGLMIRAAQLDLLDLRGAFAKLRNTSFRCRPEMLDALLMQHAAPER